ncbi:MULTISPECIES: SpoIIE family protein phosphatase [unclassified Streptomyces]|uniref:SpoIIE family protein phosphatase n=1 Tax=unclassified Streptomyces TaxID=2593676 RepID=UPI000C277AA3|nr:SpoIIE family protein phosphatase [Streptomyces sp. CB01373]PJM92134.1 PAS sensor protein [Streptomyces sp. CB01373]
MTRHRSDEDTELAELAFAQSPCTVAVFDTDLRAVSANAEMQRAVSLPEDRIPGLRLTDMLHAAGERTEQAMREVLETGERRHVENRVRVPGDPREHAWSVSLAPLRDRTGRVRGVVLSAHDTTEHHQARERLLLVNEAGSRIGSTLDIARTAQELVDTAVPRFADYAAVDLLTFIDHGDEPPPGLLTGPVTMRRTASGSAPGTLWEGMLQPGDLADYPAFSPAAQPMATGLTGVYETNESAIDRWAVHDPARAARIRLSGAHSVMVVPLRARGVTLGVARFARSHRPERFEQDDVLLAEEITARAAVCVDNARRYTRERVTAVTLQRTLLPVRLPDQTALDVASRYLPAAGSVGVGGDWFDVIPLSGARVAMVVGDVVGHGVQAAATMGRLRTAIRALADIDLPPDELLTHLDDLVIRTAAEADSAASTDAATGAAAEAAGGLGTTCLYAVYDPVTLRCCLARAGHPPPALVGPDGTADLLDLPAGLPLGLGGLPFEAAEIELPEGSLLALYTKGLIEARGRDPDEGLTSLRRALSRPARALDAVCDAVLTATRPDRTEADIALLVARTRAIGESDVATWTFPSDPEVVGQARAHTTDQLTDWGLDEAVFTSELVVSELVTNAIRYGRPPVQLRLIHDRNLICEVSDAGSSSPHLRRARDYDEGGRGLMLVAQLTQDWGTRQTPQGKTIWADISLEPT